MLDTTFLSIGTKDDNTYKKNAKIAYFILVHRLPKQFKRLFEAIYHHENYYLIHIDKKTTDEIFEDIELFLLDYPNVSIIRTTSVVWGGYSMVEAELDGMRHLLSINIQWDFFINLSGQDYPLKSQDFIRKFLGKNKSNYINVLNQKKDRPETMNRIQNHYSEVENAISSVTKERDYMVKTTAYIGGQWMILTRSCCEFICQSDEVKKYEEYYANTLIPDESFFQTVLMNTSFTEPIINDDMRAIIWVADGDIKLRPKTFTQKDLVFLIESNAFFARKFDDDIDPDIINQIEFKQRSSMLIN